MAFAARVSSGVHPAQKETPRDAMTKFRLILATTAAVLAIAPAASAAELLVNGNFEDGNTGFYSEYSYSPGNYWPEAVYGVDTNPQNGHGLFSSFGDHTYGEG